MAFSRFIRFSARTLKKLEHQKKKIDTFQTSNWNQRTRSDKEVWTSSRVWKGSCHWTSIGGPRRRRRDAARVECTTDTGARRPRRYLNTCRRSIRVGRRRAGRNERIARKHRRMFTNKVSRRLGRCLKRRRTPQRYAARLLLKLAVVLRLGRTTIGCSADCQVSQWVGDRMNFNARSRSFCSRSWTCNGRLLEKTRDMTLKAERAKNEI